MRTAPCAGLQFCLGCKLPADVFPSLNQVRLGGLQTGGDPPLQGMPLQQQPAAWPEGAGQAAAAYGMFSSPGTAARQDMASIYGHSHGMPGAAAMTPMQVPPPPCAAASSALGLG